MEQKHDMTRYALLAISLSLMLLAAPAPYGKPQVPDSGDEAPELAPKSSGRSVLVGVMSGPIGPITKDYFHRILEEAHRQNPTCVIFTMDTPGGLDASMRSIIKDMFSSPVPILIYIYPSGARAASAGALIALASHIVAMAPGTNIGAAHPVALGEGKMDEEMKAKITNDAAAYARSIAKKRGRNVEWAEKVVRESISSTAEEALEKGAIDLLASSLEDLLHEINGDTVKINHKMVMIETEGASIIESLPSLRERFLGKISDPNIAYILMLLGFFGLIFELQNPGSIFPGVIGGISILLAFFALQLLPVNYAGISLIVLAIIMFLLEIKIPSGGLLTIGGVISMVIGSIMFIDSPLPFMRVSLSVIIPAVIFTVVFFLFAVGMGLRAQKKRVSTGQRGILGEIGLAKTDVETEGSVFIHGEYWNAYSDEKIPAGSRVEVIAVEGMTLKVRIHKRKEVS